jgi:hypothetical protein
VVELLFCNQGMNMIYKMICTVYSINIRILLITCFIVSIELPTNMHTSTKPSAATNVRYNLITLEYFIHSGIGAAKSTIYRRTNPTQLQKNSLNIYIYTTGVS